MNRLLLERIGVILSSVSILILGFIFVIEFNAHTTFTYNDEVYRVHSFDALHMIMVSETTVLEMNHIKRIEKDNKFSQSFPLIGSYDLKYGQKNIQGSNTVLGESYIVTSSGEKEYKKMYRLGSDINENLFTDDMLLALRVEHVFGVKSGWWFLGLALGMIMLLGWTMIYVHYYKLKNEAEEMTKEGKVLSLVIYFVFSMVIILMNVSFISLYKYI